MTNTLTMRSIRVRIAAVFAALVLCVGLQVGQSSAADATISFSTTTATQNCDHQVTWKMNYISDLFYTGIDVYARPSGTTQWTKVQTVKKFGAIYSSVTGTFQNPWPDRQIEVKAVPAGIFSLVNLPLANGTTLPVINCDDGGQGGN